MTEGKAIAWAVELLHKPLDFAEKRLQALSDEDREMVVAQLWKLHHKTS